MATHSSILAWKFSWKEESGKLQSISLQELDSAESGKLQSIGLQELDSAESMVTCCVTCLFYYFFLQRSCCWQNTNADLKCTQCLRMKIFLKNLFQDNYTDNVTFSLLFINVK